MNRVTDKGRIVIAGGSGTLGSACAGYLATQGYQIVILSRSDHGNSAYTWVRWSPDEEFIEDPAILEGARAVLNFTGVPLDGRRWTTSYKQKIRDSRVIPARYLARLISQCSNPPAAYLGTSAIGIYGDSGNEPVDETFQSPEKGFIVDLGHEWEASHFAGNANTRSVILRISVVFDRHTGFIKRLALPATFGIYPYFGSGDQYLSWVHIDDLVSGVAWTIENDMCAGTFNIAAPEALPLVELMRKFRKAKGGPGILLSTPRWAMDIYLGEMSEVLFAGSNVSAEKLRQTGFAFKYPGAYQALEAVLKD